MTLGRVLGPCHRGPRRPPLGTARLPLSRLARPQHCLSHRPVLGPRPAALSSAAPRPVLHTSSPGALRPRGAGPALLLLLPNTQGPSPGPPLESGLCRRQR